MRLAGGLKGLVEGALARGLSGPLSLPRIRSWGLVLAYHNVVGDEGTVRGDRSLHLSRSRFADQLEILTRTTEVVPLGTILTPPADEARPRVAITFDDAYRGAVTHGVEELERRGLPATIFVAPDFIGGRSFWWDALTTADGSDGLDPGFREIALDRYGGRDREIRGEAPRHRLVEVSPHPDAVAATEAELREAAAVPGITIGSHSWSHPDLTRMSAAELSRELLDPIGWLRSRFDSVVPWLAYPYGRASPEVARAASAAGYEGALLVSGGWIHPRGPDPFMVPRYNVPAGLSNDGFTLRIAGLFAGRVG